MPAVFNLYIFNRRGDCLYYREWDRKLNTLSDDPSEERRLMFGARPLARAHTRAPDAAEGGQGGEAERARYRTPRRHARGDPGADAGVLAAQARGGAAGHPNKHVHAASPRDVVGPAIRPQHGQ